METNKQIALISGCFDSPDGPHEGHLLILSEAKKNNDILIVALNTDDYIRRKKNREPMLDELSRYVLLLNTGLVDEVILFNEDTPCDIISLYKPDFLYLGSDYADQTVPWEDLIKEWGGQICYVDRIPNISSTSIYLKSNDKRS